MVFFTVVGDREIVLEHKDGSRNVLSKCDGSQEDLSSENSCIYGTISSHFRDLESKHGSSAFKVLHPSEVESWDGPKLLGRMGDGESPSLRQQIEDCEGLKLERILVLFSGGQIGDAAILLSSVKVLISHLEAMGFQGVEVDIGRAQGSSLSALYSLRDFSGETFSLPISWKKFSSYDAYFDVDALGGLLSRPQMNKVPLVDVFLHSFGLDAAQIHAKEKRIRLQKPIVGPGIQDYLNQVKEGKKLILFNPKASVSLRSLPDHELDSFVGKMHSLLGDSWVIATAVSTKRVDGLLDLSERSSSLGDFLQILAGCDAVITVGTGTYHLADLFSIPTVLLVTGFPDMRHCRYYPYVIPLVLVNHLDRFSPILYRHKGGSLEELDSVWHGVGSSKYPSWTVQMLDSAARPLPEGVNPLKFCHSGVGERGRYHRYEDHFELGEEVVIRSYWVGQPYEHTVRFSWYDPTGLEIYSAPLQLSKNWIETMCPYMGMQPMVSGEWTVVVSSGIRTLGECKFRIGARTKKTIEPQQVRPLPKSWTRWMLSLIKGVDGAESVPKSGMFPRWALEVRRGNQCQKFVGRDGEEALFAERVGRYVGDCDLDLTRFRLLLLDNVKPILVNDELLTEILWSGSAVVTEEDSSQFFHKKSYPLNDLKTRSDLLFWCQKIFGSVMIVNEGTCCSYSFDHVIGEWLPDEVGLHEKEPFSSRRKSSRAIEGIVESGLGAASKRTLKKQWPHFLRLIPDLSGCFIGTLNISLEEPLHLNEHQFLTDEIEWEKGFKERFGFIEIGFQKYGESREQIKRAWIYTAFKSRFMLDPGRIEVITEKTDIGTGDACYVYLPKTAQRSGWVIN